MDQGDTLIDRSDRPMRVSPWMDGRPRVPGQWRLRHVVQHVVAGFCSVSSVPASSRPEDESDPTVAANTLFGTAVHRDEPGCAVCVVRAGETLYSRGFGLASVEHSVPIYPHTIFDVGSVSKQFTAAAVVKLVLDGKLSLDDAVSKHIPSFPDYGAELTVSHLLHHTSGVRDYLTTMALAGLQAENVFTEEEVVELICRQQQLNFPPGEEYLYSNSGYILLAAIVRAVTGGESLGDYAARTLFKPAGMASTFWYEDRTRVIPHRATGYAYAEENQGQRGGNHTRFTVDTVWNFDVAGDGQVYTTVEDLCRWDQMMSAAEGSPFFEMMHAQVALNSGEVIDYALGLSHGSYRGLATVGHDGSWAGYRAMLLRFPEQQMSIAIACNLGSMQPEDLAHKTADIFISAELGPYEEDTEVTIAEGAQDHQAPRGDEDGWSVGHLAGEYYSEELDVAYRLATVSDEPDCLDWTIVGMTRPARRLISTSTTSLVTQESRQITFDFSNAEGTGGFLLHAGRVKNVVFMQSS